MEEKLADKSGLVNQRMKSTRLRPERIVACLAWWHKKKEGRHSGTAKEGSACRSVVPDPKNPLEGEGDIHSLLDLLYTWLGVGGSLILEV